MNEQGALQGFVVGKVSIEPPLILAPMSGVTNSSFRRLIRRENPGAVGLLVTEFISIEGLTRQNRQSLRMMKFHDEERPISIQIFGYDIDRMVIAAQMAEAAGADIVDINSGCPVPKVVRRGGGCELMRQPAHLGKIVAAVSRAVSVPVTVKFRAGWDEQSRNAVEVARIVEDAGAQMIAVHGRTRVQLYHGLADWSLIQEVVSAVRIPVVGSGDVIDFASAQRAMQTGVAGLMIGRGALANPFLFSDLCQQFAENGPESRGETAVADLIERYAALLAEDLPEKAIIGKLKQLATQAVRAIPGATVVRKNLCRTHNSEEFLALLRLWRECLLSGRELPLELQESARRGDL